jgi:hypothetical protein
MKQTTKERETKMNKIEYTEYEKAVKAFHERNKLVWPSLCSPVDHEASPYFSWKPCECCGRKLGGDREDYNFVPESGELVKASICTDCIYYAAYGCLDDLTMTEIEKQ